MNSLNMTDYFLDENMTLQDLADEWTYLNLIRISGNAFNMGSAGRWQAALMLHSRLQGVGSTPALQSCQGQTLVDLFSIFAV